MTNIHVDQQTCLKAARVVGAAVAGIGSFFLSYHVLMYLLWALAFGEEVWPWPTWSRVMLLVGALVAAGASACFIAIFDPTRRHVWIAIVLLLASVLGLFLYAGEVSKCLFKLGFAPWS
jgi:hypothetical protein